MLNDRIRSLRKKNNLTQKELGEKIGVSEFTVSKYERGVNEPDIATLKQLSIALDCSTDYLVGNVDLPDTKVISDTDITVTYNNNNFPYDLSPAQAEKVFKLLKEYRLDVDGIIRDIKNGTIKDDL